MLQVQDVAAHRRRALEIDGLQVLDNRRDRTRAVLFAGLPIEIGEFLGAGNRY